VSEIWKAIPGYEHYQASNLGQIKSVTHYVQRKDCKGVLRPYFPKGKILKPYENQKYYYVWLSKNGDKKIFKVHHLILLTFLGPRPQNMLGCHNNGNSLDNRIENLRWDTASSNVLDTIKHGNHKFVPKSEKGSKNPSSKLKEEDILCIRSVTAYRGYLPKMAKKYNVSISCIWSIVNRKHWAHI
jgi:hypothetical protein